MKRRHRDIIVDNIKYSWSYLPNTDPYEGGGDVKIWKDKKVIFNSFIDADIQVTPSYIANLIELINVYG